MGNSSSSSARRQDETVDLGYLVPQGVYTGPRDWNHAIVTQLICQRRLAPFYRPLEEYDDSWTDEQILAARKEPSDAENSDGTRSDSPPMSANSGSTKLSHGKRANSLKEPSRPEAAIYRGAVECPICFLYYPPNINYSRCCAQAICTECFVQIKRNEPTTTHLVSEPAACPYCVQEDFGIVYTPPPWRTGIGSDVPSHGWSDSPKGSQQSLTINSSTPTHKRRQKSFSADNPEVVTIDHIRPDWEAKLAAIRAAVARRANRRIIMRQVGDRLIPVGVTSGRVHALSSEEAGGESSEGGGSRRSRRRQQNQNNPFEQYLGQDLEELMVMEAMRLSLLEHEEQQRREAEEKQKEKAGTTEAAQSEVAEAGPSNLGSSSTPTASTSTNPCSFDISTSTSPSSTPSPSSGNCQSQDSLQVQHGPSSTLANRSPSPAVGSLDSKLNEVSSRSHPSSPPPFSTLAAALSTTSTASAFLVANNSNSSSLTPNDAGPPHPDIHDTLSATNHKGNGGSSEDSQKRPDIFDRSTSESKAFALLQTPGSYEPLPSSSDTTSDVHGRLEGRNSC
ncbi:hypothetical protein E1B28_008649 [Marasmius oreades]|uniref:RING-type domain-containing protein n=1 Tax=Marasmius oreades TaxID=181124 RepID=A0A9P7RZH3_9AGAR|nr:uncharacterized protein E1B28_008649 [Marasmius oreades]KAG7092287.1 hypothetical protein E1B28_008649 [Marasmius oreades]